MVYPTQLMILNRLCICLVSFVFGKGTSGIGFPRKLHKGSQPYFTSKMSNLSLGQTSGIVFCQFSWKRLKLSLERSPLRYAGFYVQILFTISVCLIKRGTRA